MFLRGQRFQDRRDAGVQLGRALLNQVDRTTWVDPIVLALPRGGVPVAFEVARAIGAPLDILLVRKMGVPGHEELAMGAIGSGGVRIFNESVLESLDISPVEVEAVARRELAELQRREAAYRGNRPPPRLAGRTVILVDDGLATGSTMRAAVEAVRRHEPHQIIVAVPVASPATCDEFATVVDHVVCVRAPSDLYAVGVWYEDFTQTTDREVATLLEQSRRLPADQPAGPAPADGSPRAA